MKTRRYLTDRELRSLPSYDPLLSPATRSQRGVGWPGPGEHHLVGFHCRCPWAQEDEGDAGSICFVIKFLNLQSESFFFFHCHLQEKLKKKKKQLVLSKKGGQSLGVGGCWLLQKSWLEIAAPPSGPPRAWEGSRGCGAGRQSPRPERRGAEAGGPLHRPRDRALSPTREELPPPAFAP